LQAPFRGPLRRLEATEKTLDTHGDRATTIAEELRHNLDRLTPKERKPALTLLGNYPVAGLETVAQFARRSGVSAPTILRLINKLGFSGYPEFQRGLRAELEAQIQSPLSKRAHGPATAPVDRDFLQRFAAAIVDNVLSSVENVPRSEFEAAARLLADKRRPVHLLGGRFTDAVATYMYLHLRALRPNVRRLEGQPALWLDCLLDMGRQDVLVIFDVRRYQGDLIRFAEHAAKLGTTVILFTDQWLSPIARVAKHVISVRVEVPSNWDSAAATVAMVEALIARVNDRQWPAVKSRIEHLESLRRSDGDRS